MAKTSLPTTMSVGKSNNSNPISIDFLPDGRTPVISSLDVAKHFGKKHKNLLREIDKMQTMLPQDFCGLNFEPTSIQVDQPRGGTRTTSAFLLTRDAFSLLAMGFTGKQALEWKLKYIQAFNALEEASLDLARQAGFLEGQKEGYAYGVGDGVYHAIKELTPWQKENIKKVVEYSKRGFTQVEAAKLLDCHPDTIRAATRKARLIGLGV